MWLSAASLACLLVAAPRARDTTLTVHGVVLILNNASGEADRAVVLLAEPLPVGQNRVWTLRVAGKVKRMERWSGRFVEATGSIAGVTPDSLSLTPIRMKEVEPAGAVRSEVDLSLSQHAVVTVALVPSHFTVPPNGRGNRIGPVVLYKIANHGQTDLDFMFSNNEFVCVGLLREGDTAPRWTGTWKVSQPSPHLTIRIGSVFRALVPIPADQLAWPDHYTVRASLCGIAEYATVVPLEVTAE